MRKNQNKISCGASKIAPRRAKVPLAFNGACSFSRAVDLQSFFDAFFLIHDFSFFLREQQLSGSGSSQVVKFENPQQCH